MIAMRVRVTALNSEPIVHTVKPTIRDQHDGRDQQLARRLLQTRRKTIAQTSARVTAAGPLPYTRLSPGSAPP
jgi:hypothetical protein